MDTKPWIRLALAAAVAAAACDAGLNPAGPSGPETPQLQVVDGANNGGEGGFFFLPPLARYTAPTGDFDPRRTPVVEVCALAEGACEGEVVARFTTSDGPKGHAIKVFPFAVRDQVRGFYLLRWRPSDYRETLSLDRIYRVRVSVDGSTLGHADFFLVSDVWSLFVEGMRWAADPSNRPVPLLDRAPLPFAFRIEVGAVPAPPPPLWPHEPAGLTVMTDQPWDALNTLGWRHLDRAATSRIAADATAPMSPENVLEHVFPVGFTGSATPAVDYFSLYGLPGARELFVGLWFRTSPEWQGSANGFNVLQYLHLDPSGHLTVPLYGATAGPFDIRVLEGWSGGAMLPPNVGPGQVTPGVWHRFELHLRYNSAPGAADGVIRWWLDGVLVGDYRNRVFPAGNGFVEYQIAPYWGSPGDVKAQADHLRFDHTFISGN